LELELGVVVVCLLLLELELGLVVVWLPDSVLVLPELGDTDVRVFSVRVVGVVVAGRVLSVLEVGVTVFCGSERVLPAFTLGAEFSLVVVVSVLVEVLVEVPDSRVLGVLVSLLPRVTSCRLAVVGAERGLLYSLLI
jgi:hypothetical protein